MNDATTTLSNDTNPQEEEETPHHQSSTSDKVAFTVDDGGLCLKCGAGPAIYECHPCGHACFCSVCARKLATGGKCKVCQQFYGGLNRRRQ